jgi:hypothetical protein
MDCLNLDGGLKRDLEMKPKKLRKAIENYLSPEEKVLATHSKSRESFRYYEYYATDKKIIRFINKGAIRKPEIDSIPYEDVISIEKVPGRILESSVIGGLLCFIVGYCGMILWEDFEIYHTEALLFLCILGFLWGMVSILDGFAEKRHPCYQITAANQKKWLVRSVTSPAALEFIRVIEEKTSRSRRTTKEKP